MTSFIPRTLPTAHLSPREFWVTETPIGRLVVPSKAKHRWTPEERVYRSVVLGPDGEVRSSGFPKFHNVGEVPEEDVALAGAAGRGAAVYTEKLDGSLVVADLIEGSLHWRSRGHWTLPPLLAGVRDTAAQAGIDPSRFLRSTEGAPYSLLFEYTAPENRIVLAYDEPRLTLLAAVDKRTLEVMGDMEWLAGVAKAICAPLVRVQTMEGPLVGVQEAIRRARDLEGVVARYRDPSGVWRLSKLKSAWYCRIHAAVDGISPARAREQIVRAMGATRPRGPWAIQDTLHQLGYDAEAVAFVQDIFLGAQADVLRASAAYDALEALVAPLAGRVAARRAAGGKELSREDVEELRARLRVPSHFGAATQLLKGRSEEAWAGVLGETLGVSGIAVKQWMREGVALEATPEWQAPATTARPAVRITS